MSNNKYSANTHMNNNDHDTSDAVEQVYSDTAIEVIDCVKTQITTVADQKFNPQQAAANDPLAYADIHSMNSARMAKYDETLERRENKSQLTDRRSLSRPDATGESEADRRTEN